MCLYYVGLNVLTSLLALKNLAQLHQMNITGIIISWKLKLAVELEFRDRSILF